MKRIFPRQPRFLGHNLVFHPERAGAPATTFVRKGILQAAVSASEGFDTLGQVRVHIEPGGCFWCERASKQALVCRPEMYAFLAYDSDQKSQPFSKAGIHRHINAPSRKAMS